MAGKSASGAAHKAEMIRWLFENSGDLMHVVREGGLFTLVNPAWQKLTGRVGGFDWRRHTLPSFRVQWSAPETTSRTFVMTRSDRDRRPLRPG